MPPLLIAAVVASVIAGAVIAVLFYRADVEE